MIPVEIREAIFALKQQGRALREISRALKVLSVLTIIDVHPFTLFDGS